SGGQITEANFRRLEAEMTLADVEAILGQGKELADEEIPRVIQENITPEVMGKIQTVEPQRWRQWTGAETSILVGLSETDEGDRVSVLAFVHRGSFKLECNSVARKTGPPEDQIKKVLTRENYAKLKKGMTEKEVLGILGPPTSNR